MGVDNYSRFYALLKRLPGADKETLVYQYTNGRTARLSLMSAAEYRSMCDDMERVAGYDARREAYRQELRRRRSACLGLMQRMGVDTTDWARVNALCEDPRIAGEPFARIDPEGLERLAVKLRSIQRKGGLGPGRTPAPARRPGAGYLLMGLSPGKAGEA